MTDLFNLVGATQPARLPRMSSSSRLGAGSAPSRTVSRVFRPSRGLPYLPFMGWATIDSIFHSAHDSKKKKKGKREVEDLNDLYERDFYDYDYY